MKSTHLLNTVLALQQHLAPRVIQVCSFSSSQMIINCSILAGGKQSIPMTRALLKKLICRLKFKHPSAPPQVFVDDTSMSARHKKWSTVLNRIAPCILDFASGVKEIGLSLSDKAMLVASHPKLALMLKAEFAKYGIEFQIPGPREGARDPGISNTAGIHRPSRLLSNRHNKTKIGDQKYKIW